MGKIIWITGAGSGIGKELAVQYNSPDNTIILSGRKEAQLNEVAALLHNPHVLPLDVTDEQQITEAATTVKNTYGKVDILINNAGVSQRSNLLEVSNEVGRKLMEVNFFGSIHLTKAVLPMMIEANSGNIVAMSSAAGKFGWFERTYYSASKHALHGFYDALALELKNTKIKILLVCPGRVKTEISKNALKGDGSAHNNMDDGQLNGVPVDKCARKIIKAIRRGKHEIYIGSGEVALIYAKRYFPALFWYAAKKVSPN